MLQGILFVAICFWGYVVSRIAVTKGPKREHILFPLVGFFVLFLLMFLLWISFRGVSDDAVAVFGFIIMYVLGLLFYIPFFYVMADMYVGRAGTALISDNKLVVKKTFDRADAAVRQGDLETAQEILVRGVQESPEDPIPHRKLAEVLILQKEYNRAAKEYMRTAELITDTEDKALTFFLTADILNNNLGKTDDAVALLKKVRTSLQGTKYAGFAEERIRALTSPDSTQS